MNNNLTWDELCIIFDFIKDHYEDWLIHVESHGFEATTANAIRDRVGKCYLDEKRKGTNPALDKQIMVVTRGEETFEVPLELNKVDGWHITRIPSRLAFLVMCPTLESAQQRMVDKGWRWMIVPDSETSSIPTRND